MGIVMRYAGAPPPAPGMPHPFNFAAPGSVVAAMKGAGFRDVKEETLTLPTVWVGSLEEGWETVREISPTTRKALPMVPEDRQGAMISEIRAAGGKYYDGKEARYPMVVNLGSGVQ